VNDTTIRGHVKSGTGIINNELYIGRLGLESAALCQRPEHRAAGVAHERGIGVDRSRFRNSGLSTMNSGRR